jgi:hypothetical protein
MVPVLNGIGTDVACVGVCFQHQDKMGGDLETNQNPL